MKIINYCSDGIPVSDYEINDFLDKFLSSEETSVNIANALLIDEIRARIAEKRINPDDLWVMVEDEDFVIDKNGRSNDWKECLEVHSNILTRLLSVKFSKP